MKKFLAFMFAMFMSFQALANDKVLNIYIYSEYIPDSVINDFTKETGIKVNISTFESPDDLYAKITLTKGKGYDLIMSNPEYLVSFQKQGLIQRLDRSKLPNLRYIEDTFLNKSFDPKNEYFVPFTWGTSSFAVNTKKVPLDKIKSFEDLARPEFKGRIMLLNEMRAVMGMGLMMGGKSLNATSEEDIKQAYEILKTKILPNVKTFDTEGATQALLNNEVDIAQTWDGLAYAANQENPEIVYVHMKEGIDLWIDYMAILSTAKNPEGAHKFINFIHRPEVMAAIIDEYTYGNVNTEAMKLLSEEYRASPIFNLTKEEKQRMELEGDLGKALPIYEKYWTLLRSGN